jgi:hypothetical protein
MFRRLLVPLAFRSLILSVGIAGVTSLLFVAPVRLLRGEDATAVTLRDVSAGVSWSGRAGAGDAVFDPSTCRKSQTCNVFTLNVDVSDDYRKRNPDFGLAVRVAWEDAQTDFDLYLTKDGRTVKDSRQGQTNSEELRLERPPNGIYDIYVQTASDGAATAFNGRARLVPSPVTPARRSARYLKDPDGRDGPEMFQFGPEQILDRGETGERLRTDIEIDPFGNTYVSADGSDIALGDPQYALGKLYSRPRPQWAAALGGERLYVASTEDSRLTVRRSDDGGRTYKQEAVITRFPNGAPAAGQGNLVTDRSGTLFNVFAGTVRNEIYLAKCAEPCERFMTRRIFNGEAGVTVNHPYPVAAVDRARGLHVAFSEGQNIFVMSSPDGGLTWKEPARVNNEHDPDTEVATSPWIFAGDSGRVGITWLGRSGEVFYAFTPDAFSAEPAFNYVRVSTPQQNPNLPSAAVDPFGNSIIVYGNTSLVQQIAGERLFFGPFMTAAGTLQTETGTKRVSFKVRQDFSGSLTYLDEERRLSLRSARFTAKRIDQKIAVSGSGRLQDNSEVTFTLVASDPKANEKDFSISMSNGYFAAGVLESAPTVAPKMLTADQRSPWPH